MPLLDLTDLWERVPARPVAHLADDFPRRRTAGTEGLAVGQGAVGTGAGLTILRIPGAELRSDALCTTGTRNPHG